MNLLQKRLPEFSIFFIIATIAFFTGCNKLDTTNIGSDLIPEVDNVTTFADTLDIVTSMGAFEGSLVDSTTLGLTENYVIGKTNDPMMGGTDARLFLQLKPTFYPYFIGTAAGDTITGIDSVVLCLSYRSFYGDSTQPVTFIVEEVSNTAHGEWDSLYLSKNGALSLRTIRYAPAVSQVLSAAKQVDLRRMEDFLRVGKQDSVNNQIRIKLSDAFRDQLFAGDSTQSVDGIYNSDSAFRKFNNGFAIKVLSGNALVYVNPSDTKTRLELHYKKKNGSPVDTVYSSFLFNTGFSGGSVSRSAISNKIERTRNPLPSGDQELYLQTTPGTFANVFIPELTTMSNRIVHRAEIFIEQIPDPITDDIFRECNFLYLDLLDTGATVKYKPIYYDLNPGVFYDPDFKTQRAPYFPSNAEVDFDYFGGYLREKTDATGPHSYYTFNVTRHVQQILTKRTYNYRMRIFPAHSFRYTQYDPLQIPYRNPIALGRVKVGGGNHPIPEYRMKMRMVYSIIR
jgi:hypothetical protein